MYITDSNILQSSDVYELLQEINNQMILADIVVGDAFGNEIKDEIALQTLKSPNNYLTQF